MVEVPLNGRIDNAADVTSLGVSSNVCIEHLMFRNIPVTCYVGEYENNSQWILRIDDDNNDGNDDNEFNRPVKQHCNTK
jgi:hypothetical protein